MSHPLYLNHEPGHVEIRFEQYPEFDYIDAEIRIGGDTTWVQEWNLESEEPHGHAMRRARSSVAFDVDFTSVECAFPAYVRFLEAVAVGVEECAFSWNAEGPFAEMRWKSGNFTLRWSYGRQRINYSTRLGAHELVASLYGGFRQFVESAEYDPMRYEQMREWEEVDLLVRDATLTDVGHALARLKAPEAADVLARMQEAAAGRRRKGKAMTFPLDYFLFGRDRPRSELGRLPAAWDRWTRAQRLRHLGHRWSRPTSSWYGSKLRQLQSPLIESWLTKQEPQRRRGPPRWFR